MRPQPWQTSDGASSKTYRKVCTHAVKYCNYGVGKIGKFGKPFANILLANYFSILEIQIISVIQIEILVLTS